MTTLSDDKAQCEAQTTNFRRDACVLYRERCPELARFLQQRPVKAGGRQGSPGLLPSTTVCSYCFQWLQPDNHRMRLRPKRRPSARVQSVLRRKARGRRLTLVQKTLLQRFESSSSVLMATCHTCSKTSRHKGMNREYIAALAKTHGTPGTPGKHKTPQSSHRANVTTPKTPKDKTPTTTPRSSTSSNTSGSGSSSSKTPSKSKNWVAQRLGKLLMREGNQSSKKGGLKDFLSSL